MEQKLITKTLLVKGMTCVNCENRIENKLKQLNGVISATASYSRAQVKFTYDANQVSLTAIVAAIEELDYQVQRAGQKQKNKEIEEKQKKAKMTEILVLVLIVFAASTVINHFGGFNIFNSFPVAKQGLGYGALFLIGLLTSIHCVAMCGGINLSQCVPQSNSGANSGKSHANFKSSILYNLGRVVSYTIVGGIVGALGSVVSFSGAAKGIVAIMAGIFMVIMALNMLNLFPWLRRFNPRMPKIFAQKINAKKGSNSPLFVGLLNGLMPCGPLQAMQLYALSTGDPVKGALAMLLFSLGTVPLMFGLGALSSLLSKKFAAKMMTASGVLVLLLGGFMFSNGMSLSGIALPFAIGGGSVAAAASQSNTASVDSEGVQTITTKLSPNSYEPITVKVGVPVKWIIQAEAKDINGCNNQILVPKYNIQQKLVPGDNVIEFTPTETGTVPFSCWMGMIKSKITVVADINNVTSQDISGDSGGTGMAAGSGCSMCNNISNQ
ncbi:sulfite exporter TauE/SafE family protein [Acetobacterium tundrae]|uniref:Heavy metal transporter n=1 Tax=Acetobacterium tundrae TaxID=132932 RepID=A0ABR6WLA3_9FIRM|nr:sulfite exporter TauE/SafE family protein [Acetobacterium tundrae]MBC3797297.1 heavy metal transporter [Acetobacterium tundrae]